MTRVFAAPQGAAPLAKARGFHGVVGGFHGFAGASRIVGAETRRSYLGVDNLGGFVRDFSCRKARPDLFGAFLFWPAYMRMVFRLQVALTIAAIAFVAGVYLPLSIYWFFHGDPGMPGGAALGAMGLPLGVLGAVIAGLFSFIKLGSKGVQSGSK